MVFGILCNSRCCCSTYLFSVKRTHQRFSGTQLPFVLASICANDWRCNRLSLTTCLVHRSKSSVQATSTWLKFMKLNLGFLQALVRRYRTKLLTMKLTLCEYCFLISAPFTPLEWSQRGRKVNLVCQLSDISLFYKGYQWTYSSSMLHHMALPFVRVLRWPVPLEVKGSGLTRTILTPVRCWHLSSSTDAPKSETPGLQI